MSEMVAAAPVSEAPAAPQTTADITASVLESLDQSDTSESSEPSEPAARVDTTDVTAAPVKAAPAAPAKELTIEEQLLHEFGFKDARRADGREHYISRSKVLQMIGSGLKRGQARWDGERGALDTQLKSAHADLDEMRSDIQGDPKAFLRKLSSYDPRYTAFLEPAAAAPPAQTRVAEMPGPDVPLPDGSKTYSVDGIQKLIEWAVDAKMMPKVDERLRPLTEREQKDAAQRQQDDAQRARSDRTRAKMDAAQAWPGFGQFAADGSLTEFQQAVLDRLKADTSRTMTLREAYLEVHSERLAADDTARRAQWIKEQNEAPRSTSVTRSTAEPTRAPRPRTTEEIAREVIERGA